MSRELSTVSDCNREYATVYVLRRSRDNADMDKRKPKQRIFLREWRKFRNLTQDQLASRLEVDRSWISMIERGKSGYTQIFLEAAAEALGVEPADLIVRNPMDPVGYWTIWDGIAPVDRPKFAKAIEALKDTLKRTG